jgi:ubiquinone/menaquinone biosynthesis C-methylase UbiE
MVGVGVDVMIRTSQTARTRGRYNRVAPVYDVLEGLVERAVMRAWRRRLWERVPQARILEIGIGTGKNMPYYPPGTSVTAIDLSERMLDRARQRAAGLGREVDLCQMDAEHLGFPDETFDVAVATFVFCSVPLPVEGLRELGRVVRRNGDIWLIEHVRIDRPVIGRVMDALNPLVVRMMGANINRRTVENTRLAGLNLLEAADLKGQLVKLIHAKPGSHAFAHGV